MLVLRLLVGLVSNKAVVVAVLPLSSLSLLPLFLYQQCNGIGSILLFIDVDLSDVIFPHAKLPRSDVIGFYE